MSDSGRDRMKRKSLLGWRRLNTTVLGLGLVMLAMSRYRSGRRWPEARVSGLRARLNLASTSWAVKSEPSWNFTPWRRVKV